MKTITAILSIIALSACAPLSQHDSWVGDTGEVIGRVLLCPVTLCISEYEINRRWEERQEKAKYNAWYNSLTPEQQEREDQRRHERGIAAMQALGVMNMGSGPLLQYQPGKRVYAPNQVPMPQLPTNIQSQPRQGVTCLNTTSPYGGQVTTNCY